MVWHFLISLAVWLLELRGGEGNFDTSVAVPVPVRPLSYRLGMPSLTLCYQTVLTNKYCLPCDFDDEQNIFTKCCRGKTPPPIPFLIQFLTAWGAYTTSPTSDPSTFSERDMSARTQTCTSRLPATITPQHQGHNWTQNLCSNVLLPVVIVCQTADIVTPTVPFRYRNIRGVEQWITIPNQVFQGFIYVWKMHWSNCIYCDSSQYIVLYLHNFDFLVIFFILNPSP